MDGNRTMLGRTSALSYRNGLYLEFCFQARFAKSPEVVKKQNQKNAEGNKMLNEWKGGKTEYGHLVLYIFKKSPVSAL